MAYSPLTTYLPLNQAAQKYGLAEQDLLDQIEAGHIVPARLPTGELLVAETDIDASLKIKPEDYDHLRGESISMRQASQVYQVPYSTLRGWVLAGVIEAINQSETGQGKATLLDRGPSIKPNGTYTRGNSWVFRSLIKLVLLIGSSIRMSRAPDEVNDSASEISVHNH